MVEKSHTAGWWPNLYEPLRNIGQSVADWFAPRSDASALEGGYEINVELPGVKGEDVDVSVHDNSLTVRGQKQSVHEESGRGMLRGVVYRIGGGSTTMHESGEEQ